MFNRIIFLLLTSLIFPTKLLNATESQGGMPQLNPESFTSQIFWLFFFFTFLFFLNHFYFLPILKKIRDNREKTIEDFISEAKKINSSVENIIQNIKKDYQLAKNDYDKIVQSSYEKKKLEYEKKLSDVDKSYETKKDALNNQLLETKNKVILNLENYALTLSDNIYKIIMQKKDSGTKSELKKLIMEIHK